MIKSTKRILRYTPVACCFMVFVLLGSCKTNDNVPEGLLPQDRMVGVLAELYISEQKISSLGIKRDSLKQVFGLMKDSIFQRTGVSDSVFKASMNYYMDHPQALDNIYTVLIDSLNLREQRLLSAEAKK